MAHMNSSMISLVQQLAQILLANKLSIALAESCTGGLLAAHLTDLSGSSQSATSFAFTTSRTWNRPTRNCNISLGHIGWIIG
ncbi:MAG: hypothetical protein EBZ72_08725 [Burkholderiaceae bacterium]|nr:hypothetical protein [Burkholderiaceae bacterium]